MSSLRSVLLRSVYVSALALASVLFGSSCSSPGSSTGEKVRVSLRDYKSDRVFELVGESHTNRVEYYSEARNSAGRKVVPDKIAKALADEIEKRGFKGNKKPGRAPSEGGSLLTWGIEVADSSGVDHWVIGSGSDAGEMRKFQETRSVFLELYNATYAFQTVENQEGRTFFDNNTRPAQSPSRQ